MSKRFEQSMGNQEAIRRAALDEESHHGADPSTILEVRIDPAEYEQLKHLVYDCDPYEKALTGRTPERIEQETGIPTERMFPDHARILYVGDPWQKMGTMLERDNLVIIDYEYGDSAAFVRSPTVLEEQICGWRRSSLPVVIEEGERILEYEAFSAESRSSVQRIIETIRQLKKESESVMADFNSQVYRATANRWRDLRKSLEEEYLKQQNAAASEHERRNASAVEFDPDDPEHERDGVGTWRRHVWYACLDSQRAFRDIADWREVIEPQLLRHAQTLRAEGRPEEQIHEELQRLEVQLIDNIRLRKRTEKSHIIKGIFPELPFRDRSFDRFVASWSISAHAFPRMSKADFLVAIKEIARVLSTDGEAYIFPFDYRNGIDFRALEQSLEGVSASMPIQWEWYAAETGDALGQDDKDSAYTLWIKRLVLDA